LGSNLNVGLLKFFGPAVWDKALKEADIEYRLRKFQ
jgi:hypothetical protein